MIVQGQTVLALLPTAARRAVEELVRALRKALGDELVAVVAYGSAVRGGLGPESDVDLLVVIAHDDAETLLKMAGPLQVARAAARVDARVLVNTEIARAADVFPIFYDDVQHCHAVLFGKDPFRNLLVHHEHRRLHVEQELREARVELRRLVVDHAFDEDVQLVQLRRLLKRVRAPLFSLLQLHKNTEDHHHKINDDLTAVLDLCGARFHIDTVPLTTKQATLQQTLSTFTRLLDAAVVDVDTLGERPA